MGDRGPWRETLAAGCVGPIIGAVWGTIVFVALIAFSGGVDIYQWTVLIIVSFLYGLFIALFLTWTFGLAWHTAAYSMGWTGKLAYTLVGGACGAIIATVLSLTILAPLPVVGHIAVMAWITSTGACVALTGWLIRRPDRDRPPTAPNASSA